ncbi:MAG: DnaD domain-containing protein [Atopococcus tabaci]|uniref:DnaD domain-containing protein n=1 Tax=Atopococcus tabaci TaxID=269774 RepID=A0AA43RNI6_9LACT|nr:DnaD domain-containing protein [Atopococcus tabaci]
MTLDFFLKWQADGNVSLPNALLDNYRELQIDHEELVLIIQIKRYIDAGINFPTVTSLAQVMDESEEQIYNSIHGLIQKKILSIKQSKNKNERSHDHYSLDLLWEKLYHHLLQKHQNKQRNQDITEASDLIQIFESEFGRPLTPMEIEKLGAWINQDRYSPQLIEIALKEAVLNQVYNFNYIDRILRNWEKKNIKTAQDVKREQEKFNNYQSKKNNKGQDAAIQKEVPIFNWLDGEKNKK